MRIEIMDGETVINTINADEAFAEQHYPGAWRVAAVQDVEPAPASQFEKDEARYKRRAAVKDSLLAYMAADNMSRVRSGAWTVSDLTGLMADPAVAAANAYMSTLSFELAAQGQWDYVPFDSTLQIFVTSSAVANPTLLYVVDLHQ